MSPVAAREPTAPPICCAAVLRSVSLGSGSFQDFGP